MDLRPPQIGTWLRNQQASLSAFRRGNEVNEGSARGERSGCCEKWACDLRRRLRHTLWRRRRCCVTEPAPSIWHLFRLRSSSAPPKPLSGSSLRVLLHKVTSKLVVGSSDGRGCSQKSCPTPDSAPWTCLLPTPVKAKGIVVRPVSLSCCLLASSPC